MLIQKLEVKIENYLSTSPSFACPNFVFVTFYRKGNTKLLPELRVLNKFKPLVYVRQLASKTRLKQVYLTSRFVKLVFKACSHGNIQKILSDLRFESVKKIELTNVLSRNFQMFERSEFLKISVVNEFSSAENRSRQFGNTFAVKGVDEKNVEVLM